MLSIDDPDTSKIIAGWNNIANIPPNKVPKNSAGIACTFFMIIAITKIGTENNHGLITNLLEIIAKACSICSDETLVWK